jgi:hypothetical protein
MCVCVYVCMCVCVYVCMCVYVCVCVCVCKVDEEEHSIEMHLPFVAYLMQQQLELAGSDAVDYSVVPIMIGVCVCVCVCVVVVWSSLLSLLITM